MDWDREELARETLERVDVGVPVDPEVVALELGLEIYDGGAGCEGLLVGDEILIDEHMRTERRAFGIGHELGHWLQRRHGLPDTEHGANYLASAVLLPRDDFERDLRRCGWDLLRLRSLHRWASFEACARRIVALREARVFVFDRPLRGQKGPSWYSVPWGRSPSDEERIAAREAVSTGAPVEIRAGLTGWPVIQDDWLRAITLAAV